MHGGSVTRAAEMLCLSQPAVAKLLRALEDETGLLLFDRRHRRLRVADSERLAARRRYPGVGREARRVSGPPVLRGARAAAVASGFARRNSRPQYRRTGLGPPWPAAEEGSMDEDRFNMSVRKFLKVVGVTSQREIENAVREALKSGRLKGDGAVRAKATISIEAIGLAHEVEDEIELG